MDLYLIVTLPFSPSSFRHFLIYSASSFPDSDMQKNHYKFISYQDYSRHKFSKIRFCEKQCVPGIWKDVFKYQRYLRSKLEIPVQCFHNGFKNAHNISIPYRDQRLSFSLHSGLYSLFQGFSLPLDNPDHTPLSSFQNLPLALDFNSMHKRTLEYIK